MKGPCQSTHMGTISFPIPDGYGDSSDYTYPISIGRKGANHSIVFSFLFDEMKEMKQRQKDTWYYSKYLKEMVRVELCLIASLQDQPEQRDLLFLCRGNSNYHIRFGFSCLFAEVQNQLRACATCQQSMLDEISSVEEAVVLVPASSAHVGQLVVSMIFYVLPLLNITQWR